MMKRSKLPDGSYWFLEQTPKGVFLCVTQPEIAPSPMPLAWFPDVESFRMWREHLGEADEELEERLLNPKDALTEAQYYIELANRRKSDDGHTILPP